MTKFCVVYITTPPGKAAKNLATAILKVRLAACVNIVPSITSHYWWKNKIESAGESLLMVKTRTALVKKLIQFVSRHHPYSVPEIISLPLLAGNKPYFSWLVKETKS